MRVALTDRFVAGAKAAGAYQIDYFDAGTPGLALRVSQRGHKAWTFVFTSPKDAKRARLTLGSYPATPLAAARTLALEAAGHVDAGMDPRDVLAARDASAMTVAGLCESYLEKHVRPNMRSAANFEQRLRKNVIPIIGPVKLADLHPRDINAAIDPIMRRGRPTEANRVFENLRAMIRWGVRRGDLDRNPMDRMAKPAVENGARERVLSDDEIRHLWRILPTALAQSKAAQRIVQLCLLTGQRVGEVAGMTVAEIDLDLGLWSLPGSRTKNGSGHTVPLSDMATAIIREAIVDAGEDAEFIFPSRDVDGRDHEPHKPKAIDPHAIATTLRRAHVITKERPKGRFGMAAFTAPDLRRTALTGLAQLGAQPIVIGAVANHLSVTKSSVTFAHYVRHDYAKEKREALNLWAERMAAIVTRDPAVIVPIRKGA